MPRDTLTFKLKDKDTPYTTFTWGIIGAGIARYIKTHPNKRVEGVCIGIDYQDEQKLALVEITTQEAQKCDTETTQEPT